ncbi:MAG: large subunit ribosomal protein L5 [Candidatus Deianiraeaceae bacterium]|jgi:large subunit ribosomal protein L5
MSNTVVLSKEKYTTIVRPDLQKQFDIKNPMSIPYIEKVVVSTSLGADAQDKNYYASVKNVFRLLTGQECISIKAKKSVAAFKLREGMNSGFKVTLRRENMYNFIDRLVYVNLPRIKDFKGYSKKSIDLTGNFNIGISDCTVFHEVDYGMVSRPFGMSITFHIKNSNSKDLTHKLLTGLEIPIK